jgi:hypothetical protein
MSLRRPPVLAQLTYRQHSSNLERLELADKFCYIHRTNMWGSPDSTSGVGSSFDATVPVRRGLAEVCRRYAIKSLLDAPCGEASWITASSLPIQTYIGLDIVPELIAQNLACRLSSDREFRVADLTKDPLPACDLILCRDCLVHLRFANIQRVISNVKKSGSKYLLTTTFINHERNEDIADGDWRLLNLEKPPFNFPEPILLINEECTEIGGAYRDKSLGLWEIGSLPL